MIKKTTLAIVAAVVAGPLIAILAPSTADARLPPNDHSNCNLKFMYYHNGESLDARDKPDDFIEIPTSNAGNIMMKKSNPCDGLDSGLCDGFKHGG
jgi:hypothetical protein